MDKCVEIEFENRTSLIRLSDIRLLELLEEENITLSIHLDGDVVVAVETDAGNENWVRKLYRELKAKLGA